MQRIWARKCDVSISFDFLPYIKNLLCIYIFQISLYENYTEASIENRKGALQSNLHKHPPLTHPTAHPGFRSYTFLNSGWHLPSPCRKHTTTLIVPLTPTSMMKNSIPMILNKVLFWKGVFPIFSNTRGSKMRSIDRTMVDVCILSLVGFCYGVKKSFAPNQQPKAVCLLVWCQ